MCSPVLNLPSYKETPESFPCYPVQGIRCLPCGQHPVTLKRPLIVGDSTFDYRPTSRPAMLLNKSDKKVRYQLINYERRTIATIVPRLLNTCNIYFDLSKVSVMCNRMSVINQLQTIMSSIQSGGPYSNHCCVPHCPPPCCDRNGSLVTVYNAILAVGQPPKPVAVFDKATIAIGHHGPNCVTSN